MDFLSVRLRAPSALLPALGVFYGERLGIERLDRARFRIGATELELVPAGAGEPFYHVALLVPGNRFDAAFDWARERVGLLPEPQSDELVFDFRAWNARACYFHDPAGNIVELISHRGVGRSEKAGAFEAGELLGLSELGLVGRDTAKMAEELRPLDLSLWDGTIEEPGRLAFVGEQARTLILSPAGRGWLPTGRPAEPHPVDACLSGRSRTCVTVGSVHRVSTAPRERTGPHELLDRYVELHNRGVRTGDFSGVPALFAPDGVMQFEGSALGALSGRDAVAAAFDSDPPRDDLVLLERVPSGGSAEAVYGWAARPHIAAGRLRLEERQGLITELAVIPVART